MKRRILSSLMALVLVFGLLPATPATAFAEGEAASTAKTIYVDKETGVNYLFIASGYAGGLTPLLVAEGKPVITKKTAD